MSTLTALKLERELQITRRAMAEAGRTPKLVMQWRIDPATGRAVRTWVAVNETVAPVVMPEPAFV